MSKPLSGVLRGIFLTPETPDRYIRATLVLCGREDTFPDLP
jgi:hypothetical protein